MYKKATIIVLAILLFSIAKAISQDKEIENYSFDTEPLKEERIQYFAIAGGYVGTFFSAPFDELNKHIKDAGFGTSEFKSPIFMSGVQGFIGIPWVPNLRLGFIGMAGISDAGFDTTISSVAYRRSTEYSIAFSGLTVDYGFVLFNAIALLPGATLGWGSLNIESYQAPSDFDWVDYKPSNMPNSFYNKATAGFWYIEPHLNLEFAWKNVIMLRANVGYSVSIMKDWKYNNTANLKNVPDAINASGLNIQFGIFVGLFNY